MEALRRPGNLALARATAVGLLSIYEKKRQDFTSFTFARMDTYDDKLRTLDINPRIVNGLAKGALVAGLREPRLFQ